MNVKRNAAAFFESTAGIGGARSVPKQRALARCAGMKAEAVTPESPLKWEGRFAGRMDFK